MINLTITEFNDFGALRKKRSEIFMYFILAFVWLL